MNHLQEFLTTRASEPPPDRIRPCNRNLRPPNQDLHQIGKRTLSIKSPVRTAHGITSEKRVDAYTLEKRNTYETAKFLKVAPILPAMRGSKATLFSDFENARVIHRGNRPISNIKIQPETIDLSTTLVGITTEFVGFIPKSLVLRSIVLG